MWEESPKADEQLKLSDSAAYPSFLPELCKFRHKRGVWSNGLQTLLLEAPGRISQRCLRSYRAKRQHFYSHLRKPLHSYLFYITFPKVLWLKKFEDPPFYTRCPRSQITSPLDPLDSWHSGSQHRCVLDRAHFSKSCRLMALSRCRNNASDAHHESEKKSLFLCNESGSCLLRIDFP